VLAAVRHPRSGSDGRRIRVLFLPLQDRGDVLLASTGVPFYCHLPSSSSRSSELVAAADDAACSTGTTTVAAICVLNHL
jgi:hypothetical protein